MKEFITRIITSFFLGFCFWLSYIFLPPIVFSCILFLILMIIIIYEWTKLFNMNEISYWAMLPFYPVLPFALLIIMNQSPIYHGLLLELFIVVASHDTGSYIVGNLIGRHKIWPSISPGKTWEGFFGGYSFALVGLSLVTLYEQHKAISWWVLAIFTLIICTLALLGDIFESWLKRRAGIKHSGTMLPGHGGFLDRFDGIMFAVFFFYLFKDQLILLFG